MAPFVLVFLLEVRDSSVDLLILDASRRMYPDGKLKALSCSQSSLDLLYRYIQPTL